MQDEIITGLESMIQQNYNVINKTGEGSIFISKALATAVSY